MSRKEEGGDGLSLRKLIFARSSSNNDTQQQQEQPSIENNGEATKKRERKDPPTKKNDNIEKNVESKSKNDDDGLMIDEFYQLSQNKEEKKDDVDVDRDLYDARRRKVPKSRKRDWRWRAVDYVEEELWETDSQVRQRLERTRRYRARIKLRQRWKARAVNPRDEEDIGNAIQYTANMILKQRARVGGEKKEKPTKEEEAPLMYQDSSEDEAAKVEKRLLSLSQRTLTQDLIQQDDDPAMNYWEQGFAAPNTEHMAFHYQRDFREGATVLRRPAEDLPLDEEDTNIISKNAYRSERGLMPYRIFPLRGHTRTEGPRTFFHHKTMRVIASRYLLSTRQEDNTRIPNRLLRLLYRKSRSLRIDREQVLIAQALERGMNLQLFRQHLWKDRSVVVRALGLTGDDDAPGFWGDSLEGRLLSLRQGKRRRMLANTMSLETIQDNHDANTKQEPPETQITPIKDNDLDPENKDRMEQEEMGHKSPTMVPSDATTSSTPVDVVPWSGYVHTRGSIPPIPVFPLDESGVVHGGEDRYARIGRHPKIDQGLTSLTLSTLLGRLGQARLDDDDDDIAKQHGHIMSFLDDLRTNNSTSPMDFSAGSVLNAKEMPLVGYHRAVMAFCSYVLNAGSTLSSDAAGTTSTTTEDDCFDDDYDDDDDDDDDGAMLLGSGKSFATTKELAETITDVCELCLDHPGLTRMPKIHAVVALTFLAKALPAEMVDLIARPDENDSPVQIIRELLEQLELDGLLSDRQQMEGSTTTVHVGVLEHWFHKASEVLHERCVLVHPEDTEYRSWHLALLAGSLLLCSGNRIGADAHVHPSFLGRAERVPHEARKKLGTFDEVRHDTAHALSHFIDHADDSMCGHDVLVSMMEWNQVMALLVGPGAGKAPWDSICHLHKKHLLADSLHNTSRQATQSLELLDVGHNQRLDHLACWLENDPGEVKHWRRLIRALGPLTKTGRCSCTECQRVKRGQQLVFHERDKQGDWWGKERRGWWDKLLLAPAYYHESRSHTAHVYRECGKLEERLLMTTGYPTTTTQDNTKQPSHDTDPTMEGLMDATQWLQSAMSPPKTKETNVPSLQGRTRVVDPSWLPFGKEHDHAGHDDEDCDDENDPRLPPKNEFEWHAYRIVLLCHLYGVVHESVGKNSWDLVYLQQRNAKGNTQRKKGEAWDTILWLHHVFGLHLTRTLHDYHGSMKLPYLHVPRRRSG